MIIYNYLNKGNIHVFKLCVDIEIQVKSHWLNCFCD